MLNKNFDYLYILFNRINDFFFWKRKIVTAKKSFSNLCNCKLWRAMVGFKVCLRVKVILDPFFSGQAFSFLNNFPEEKNEKKLSFEFDERIQKKLQFSFLQKE